jgi:hypothetical protein
MGRLLLLLGLISSGCAAQRIAFLHDYRAPGRLTAKQLEGLQFFVSGDIVLRREVDTSQHQVSDRVYRYVDGKLVDEIRLPAGTPGMVTKVEDGRLHVSFEEEGALPFEYLPAMEGAAPEGYRFPFKNGRTVKYRGAFYQVIAGGLGQKYETYLLIEADWGSRFEDQRRVLPGRVVASTNTSGSK